MPENAAVGAARLMAVVSWVSRQPLQSATVGEIADHFGRSVKQVERDIEHLTYFRDSRPVDSFELVWEPCEKGARLAQRRENTVTVREPHGAALPTVLTAERGAQAIVQLRALAPVLPEDLAAALPATVLAIEALSGAVLPASQAIADAHDGDAAVLQVIRRAIEGREVLSLSYQKIGGSVRDRVVEPCMVRRAAHGWVLRAVDRELGEHRHFAVSRIGGVRPLGEFFGEHVSCGVSVVDVVRVGVTQRGLWLVDDYAELVDRRVGDDGGVVYVADIPVWSASAVRDLLISVGEAVVFIDDAVMRGAVRDHALRACGVWGAVLAGVQD